MTDHERAQKAVYDNRTRLKAESPATKRVARELLDGANPAISWANAS
jgi:hypothetical protein